MNPVATDILQKRLTELEGILAPYGSALVAFSDNDPVFPFPRAGERFVEWIPTVTDQVKIEGAAHFLQEDRGEQIAGEILHFLD